MLFLFATFFIPVSDEIVKSQNEETAKYKQDHCCLCYLFSGLRQHKGRSVKESVLYLNQRLIYDFRRWYMGIKKALANPNALKIFSELLWCQSDFLFKKLAEVRLICKADTITYILQTPVCLYKQCFTFFQ